jgi:hypothetical protein
MRYAGYQIDGSRTNDFKAEAVKLFSNPEFKKELQWRIVNLNKETPKRNT